MYRVLIPGKIYYNFKSFSTWENALSIEGRYEDSAFSLQPMLKDYLIRIGADHRLEQEVIDKCDHVMLCENFDMRYREFDFISQDHYTWFCLFPNDSK